MKIKLMRCPFCDSEKVKLGMKSVLDGFMFDESRVERHTYSIRCNTCHARGSAFGGRVIVSGKLRGLKMGDAQLPTWATTDEALRLKAADAWNRRYK